MDNAIEFQDIMRKDPMIITANLFGTTPQTAANYGAFFGAPFPCEVLAFRACWGTQSSSGTLQLEKLASGVAVGAGTALLSGTISTSGTANTDTTGTLTTTVLNRQLVKGDRLGLLSGGTLTSLTNLTATVVIKPLGKGHYS